MDGAAAPGGIGEEISSAPRGRGSPWTPTAGHNFVGGSSSPAGTDGVITPIGCVPDTMQRPPGRSVSVPFGGEAYAPVSTGFMMSAPLPQRPVSPIMRSDLSQVIKLTEGVPSGHMGMLGIVPTPKTPPKSLPLRHLPEPGFLPENRPGKLEGCATLPAC
ncbi:hypothetical protein cyc_01661 [Cyclospora cayetanensis]|uniref:Uncharacterized protein n=1 Tax=Cyclospora cayetanensis TaxID=88456 RepID=A0A1D3D5B9_9EIME|nr:hypothetical protein cyc_01661 [Cyclospora cayetanensis]